MVFEINLIQVIAGRRTISPERFPLRFEPFFGINLSARTA
jgi:hypothetical protein